MGLSGPSSPILPTGGKFPIPPSDAPQKNHAWSNITNKATGLFKGLKGKWNENTPNEKRYLIIAAAILVIILLLFSAIGMFAGFSAAFQMLPALLPLTFAATWPMLGYGLSKQRRKAATPKEIEAEKKREKRIAETAKSNWLYNKKIRKERAERLAKFSQSSTSSA